MFSMSASIDPFHIKKEAEAALSVRSAPRNPAYLLIPLKSNPVCCLQAHADTSVHNLAISAHRPFRGARAKEKRALLGARKMHPLAESSIFLSGALAIIYQHLECCQSRPGGNWQCAAARLLSMRDCNKVYFVLLVVASTVERRWQLLAKTHWRCLSSWLLHLLTIQCKECRRSK